MQLTDQQRYWTDLARDFATDVLRPASLERDQIAHPFETFDWDIIRAGSKLGFRTLALSEKYGGHEQDGVTQALVMMELARGDGPMAKTFTQCWKWSRAIEDMATPEQQDRFLPVFAEDDTYLLGSAKTEPSGGGSDGRLPSDDPRSGWMLRAERDGDEWVLNGTKHFIANGSVAKLFVTATRTDRSVRLRDGATIFLVESSTPGFSVARVHDKIGWRFYQNAELIFDNVRVPDANRVSEVNRGYDKRNKSSGFGDIELAALATGTCDAAVEMALDHARSHRRGGMPLIDHQTIRLYLSEMDMLTEALRSLTLRAAAEGAYGPVLHDVAAMNFATEVLQRVTDLNLEIHAPDGLRKDVGAEKLAREASIWMHLAGDSVQRLKGAAKLQRKLPA